MNIPRRQFQVAGHTDSVPIRMQRFPSSGELTCARALTVVHRLVERGMPAERASAAGYGEARPVESNATAQGRQLNRHIEIALLPNLDELLDLTSLEALDR